MNQIFPLESQPLDPKRAKGDHEKDKFLSWWSGFSCWIREGQDLIKKMTSFWHDDLDFRVGSEKDKIRGGSVLVPGTRSRGVGASFRGVAFRNVFWVRPPSFRLLLVNLDKHRPYNVWGLPVPFQPWGLYHLSHGFCISKLNKWLLRTWTSSMFMVSGLSEMFKALFLASIGLLTRNQWRSSLLINIRGSCAATCRLRNNKRCWIHTSGAGLTLPNIRNSWFHDSRSALGSRIDPQKYLFYFYFNISHFVPN